MISPSHSLSLFDCICIIVGVIIGSGIYRTTPLITGAAGSPVMALSIWLLGGLIVINGALAYAELVISRSRRGGDYAFLSAAYGRWLGFLFAWTEFWIIRPANVGAMAFVYGEYAHELLKSWLPWGATAPMRHAGIAVTALTLVNLIGFRSSARTQNVLTSLKVLGLGLLLLTALFATPAAPAPVHRASQGSPAMEARPLESMAPVESVEPGSSVSLAGFQLAIILVLFTYGGWNDISYVAAEVREPRRNLPRALVLGSLTVIAIYLLVNMAFLHVLGYQGVVNSKAVAADMMTHCVGPWGGQAISLLICLSCLGAISAMIFTGSRIYHALGADHALVGWLGRWSDRGAPTFSILAQGAVMLTMVLVLGRDEQGFERLAVFAAPFFWVFFTLVAVSIFILRWRENHGERPEKLEEASYRAPLYHLNPLLLVVSCGFMLYSSLSHLIRTQLAESDASFQSLWSVAVVGIGLGLGISSSRSAKK
ncbi:MAG: amino acid permease [Planctomycetales bacterium]|nr:amino acid permease [Planctomycetales bacterium]